MIIQKQLLQQVVTEREQLLTIIHMQPDECISSKSWESAHATNSFLAFSIMKTYMLSPADAENAVQAGQKMAKSSQ